MTESTTDASSSRSIVPVLISSWPTSWVGYPAAVALSQSSGDRRPGRTRAMARASPVLVVSAK